MPCTSRYKSTIRLAASSLRISPDWMRTISLNLTQPAPYCSESIAILPSIRSFLSAFVIVRPNSFEAKSQYRSTPLASFATTSFCIAAAITTRSSMLDESPTSTVLPSGAMMALRIPADGPRAGMFCQFIWLPPDSRPVVLAPQKFRYTGRGPRSAISLSRSTRVSAIVVFTPMRADTAASTSGLISDRAMNALSVLANAYVSLPVVGLILRGGSTPSERRWSANLSLDMITSFMSAALASKSTLRCTSFLCCSTSAGTSPTNWGSVNMRMIMSIWASSIPGIWGIICKASARQILVSPLQYWPYCARNAGLISDRCIPIAACTSSPLGGSLYSFDRLARECDFSHGLSIRPMGSVSIHSLGRTPIWWAKMNPSNNVLWQHTAEFSQS